MPDEKIKKAVEEAIQSAKPRKFTETVEMAINLRDIDMSIPKNRIKEDIILPHGRGKPVKVALICGKEMAEKAKGVADLIILPEELETYAEDKKKTKRLANSYDFFIAEAPFMPTIGKVLGKALGPRGKMPKPLPPGSDPKGIIENLRKTVSLNSKDKLVVHAPVGRTDMPSQDITENIEAILKRLHTKLERGSYNIKSAYVKTTMGPSVRIV